MKRLYSLLLTLSVFTSVSGYCVEPRIDAQYAINSIDSVLNSKSSKLSDEDRANLVWAKERIHYMREAFANISEPMVRERAFSTCVTSQELAGQDHLDASHYCVSLLDK
jgi:hypothetical protein